MKRTVALILAVLMAVMSGSIFAFASDEGGIENPDVNIGAEIEDVDVDGLEINAKSAILMEAESGEILYAKNASEALAPASVTKIMTLLLIAEAIDEGRIKLEDTVTVSANATGMGGSQVFLSEGEQFTVEELLKCTVIASANDAAVALAEHLAGTEENFVAAMNKRAAELGMKSTEFENVTGLDDTTTRHLTSAYDIALMSRELIKHEVILKYSKVWQDEIRDGSFVLTNTNRLVRYYSGCTGLKTGSTDKAGFCVSATAERDGMHLIAVIMGAETRDERNNAARALLDYGFASYAIFNDPSEIAGRVSVRRGTLDAVNTYSGGFCKLVEKGSLSKIERVVVLPEFIVGAHSKGDTVGEIIYRIDGEEIGRSEIVIQDDIGDLNVFHLFLRIIYAALS